jgi:hypothetical protein
VCQQAFFYHNITYEDILNRSMSLPCDGCSARPELKATFNTSRLAVKRKRQNLCKGTFMVSVDAIAEKNNVDETATADGETVMGVPINDINYLFNPNDNFRAAGQEEDNFCKVGELRAGGGVCLLQHTDAPARYYAAKRIFWPITKAVEP